MRMSVPALVSDPGPASAVVQLAAGQAASRAADIATRSYENEVGFYRDLAPPSSRADRPA
jgi:hypothetical protein